nr:PREDICTED: DDB1- and CUL4-associated factor 12 [Bemisia tabaci]XP_018915666.1 PREDICTED: DDB1- and CUL4-associated factor 12 [Bemisia tabaci]
MAQTRRLPVYGVYPPCNHATRMEDYLVRVRSERAERARKPDKPDDFICYSDTEDDEDLLVNKSKFNTSFNFVDYIVSRQTGLRDFRCFKSNFASEYISTHEMFKEWTIPLTPMNKVFSSQWLSDRQIAFGTKCYKLMVYDVVTQKLDQIPLLEGRREFRSDSMEDQGIHTLEINPSRTLLTTIGNSANEVAVYKLPTLEPVCIGEKGHDDMIFDMVWLDDEFLVSGGKDTKMALWRVPQFKRFCPTTTHYMEPLVVKTVKNADRVRSLVFNRSLNEIVALTLNGFIHVWKTEEFRQKITRKLQSSQENACMAMHGSGTVYAIGSKSYTALLDSRTIQPIRKIVSKNNGYGIRSLSFQGDMLTIGTGLGTILFYDWRAGRYIVSKVNSSRTISLKTSRGFVQFADNDFVDHGFQQNLKYLPAIYTHCYDLSGVRLFAAGGPLDSNTSGHYAGLWQ